MRPRASIARDRPYTAGRNAESVDTFRRSLAIRERGHRRRFTRVGESLDHLGSGRRHARSGRQALVVEASARVDGARVPVPPDVRRRALRGSARPAPRGAGDRRRSRRAVAIAEAAHPTDHPTTGYTLANLAVGLNGLGQREEALAILRRSLSIFEHTLGPKHRETAGVSLDIGGILVKLGRASEAEEAIQRGSAILDEILPPDHPLHADALRPLADLRLLQGRPAEAIPLLDRALDLVKDRPSERGSVEFSRARALLAAKKRADAALSAAAAQADLERAGPSGAATLAELIAWREHERRRDSIQRDGCRDTRPTRCGRRERSRLRSPHSNVDRPQPSPDLDEDVAGAARAIDEAVGRQQARACVDQLVSFTKSAVLRMVVDRQVAVAARTCQTLATRPEQSRCTTACDSSGSSRTVPLFDPFGPRAGSGGPTREPIPDSARARASRRFWLVLPLPLPLPWPAL
jgi:tetratricopeptide (TPR) repeat protein